MYTQRYLTLSKLSPFTFSPEECTDIFTKPHFSPAILPHNAPSHLIKPNDSEKISQHDSQRRTRLGGINSKRHQLSRAQQHVAGGPKSNGAKNPPDNGSIAVKPAESGLHTHRHAHRSPSRASEHKIAPRMRRVNWPALQHDRSKPVYALLMRPMCSTGSGASRKTHPIVLPPCYVFLAERARVWAHEARMSRGFPAGSSRRKVVNNPDGYKRIRRLNYIWEAGIGKFWGIKRGCIGLLILGCWLVLGLLWIIYNCWSFVTFFFHRVCMSINHCLRKNFRIDFVNLNNFMRYQYFLQSNIYNSAFPGTPFILLKEH